MKRLTLPALALSLTLAACGGSAPHMPNMPQGDAASLAGVWRITEIAGEASGGSLSFDAGDSSYSAEAGCNTLFGQYRANGQNISFDEPAGTLKGCEPQLMARDAKLGQSLAAGASWQQQGRELDIRNAAGEVVLRATR